MQLVGWRGTGALSLPDRHVARYALHSHPEPRPASTVAAGKVGAVSGANVGSIAGNRAYVFSLSMIAYKTQPAFISCS